MEDVNLVAVFIAAVASYAIGAAWYSQSLFGAAWLKEKNMTPETMKGGMSPKLIAIGFAAELVAAYVLAIILAAFGGNPFIGAGFVWLGFQATILLNGVMYEGNSWKLYGINAGYRLVGLLAMAAALSWIG